MHVHGSQAKPVLVNMAMKFERCQRVALLATHGIMEIMNVSLTPRLKKLVTQKVASGRYGSASEVVREALRLFEERERLRETQLAELRREVLVGVRALDRGDSVPFDRKTAEAIKAEGRRRLTSRTKRD